MRRIPLVLVGAVVALLITAAPALAIWPTTCVEANDGFEFAAGRHENVGIYQRVFGNAAAAEAACRNDHRGDIQGAFGWALQDGQPQPTANPREHPDWQRVRDAAQARSTNSSLSATIADSVIQRGAVDAFLRGVDDGVKYGGWPCQWRSATCPISPEQPAEPPPAATAGPLLDAGLRPAWRVLMDSEPGSWLPRVIGSEAVAQVIWADDLPNDSYAGWAPDSGSIGINSRFAGERPAALATLIAHEFWHALQPASSDTFDQCVAEEVRAFITQSVVWLDVRPSDSPRTSLERSLESMMNAWLDDPGDGGDSPLEDISGYPGLRNLVLYGYGYATICAA